MATRSSSRSSSTPAAARTQRTDGNTTRLHILETAGQLFAERGFAEATSKEICTRAGTNMAAINYHFNGRDGLYEAVLIEAHRQLVSIDELVSLASVPTDPRLKLRAFLTHLIEMGSQPKAPWGFRVVLREALSPSPAMPVMIKQAVLPKAKLLRGLLGAIMGLPDDHPSVQRSAAVHGAALHRDDGGAQGPGQQGAAGAEGHRGAGGRPDALCARRPRSGDEGGQARRAGGRTPARAGKRR
jgi:AcrR family transcriptional regulator